MSAESTSYNYSRSIIGRAFDFVTSLLWNSSGSDHQSRTYTSLRETPITSFSDDFIAIIDSAEKIENIYAKCRALRYLGSFQCGCYAEMFDSLAKSYAWGLNGIEENRDRSTKCFTIAHKLLRLRDELNPVTDWDSIPRPLTKANTAANIDENDDIPKEYTPLTWAVNTNNLEKIKHLLKARNDPNKFDKSNFSPLGHASICGHLEAAKLLIEAGADINLSDSIEGYTPLILAVYHDHPELVEYLIQAKADVNLCTKKGFTALHFSLQLKYKDIFKMLLKADAQFNTYDHPLRKEITLPIFLKSMCKYDWKYLFDCLKIKMKNVDPAPFTYEKQYFQAILLAHAFEIAGEIEIQGYKINLEGSHAPVVAACMAKSFKQFATEFPDLIDETASQDLIKNLSIIADNELRIAYDLQDLFECGKPIFIPTGYEGHGVIVLIWNSHLAICDRAHEDLDSVEIVRINPAKLTIDIIEEILELGKMSKEDYLRALVNGRNSTILNKLEHKKSFNECFLEIFSKLPMQTVGNCAWACMEGALKVFLLLASLEEEDFELPETHEEQLTFRLSAEERFRVWQLFQKITLLEKYIKSGFNPDEISPHLFEYLESSCKSIPHRFRNHMESRIQNVHALL